MKCASLTLAVLALGLMAARAQPQAVQAFGVVEHLGSFCTVVETDDGLVFGLSDVGGFAPGDRVRVTGDVTGFLACGELPVPLLTNTIEAAFAGTGRLTSGPRGPRLVTPGGEVYDLGRDGGLLPDTEVFVKGVVGGARGGPPLIDISVIGAARTAFGRLRADVGGTWLVDSDEGVLRPDAVGLPFPEDGDFVFVEGWVESGTDPLGGLATPGGGLVPGPGPDPAPGTLGRRPVTPQLVALHDNTTRRAFEWSGQVIDGPGGLLFKADHKIFEDEFDLEDFGGFGAGSRAFVRGRSLSDYDPLEPRSNALIRSSVIDPEVADCGVLVEDGGELYFSADGGELVRVEHAGAFAPGQSVYVAGALADDDDDGVLPVFAHNIIHPCIERAGSLQQGFECTPVFVAGAGPDGFGNVFLLENLDGHEVGESFCVRGAVTACESVCPVPCLSANITHDCTR